MLLAEMVKLPSAQEHDDNGGCEHSAACYRYHYFYISFAAYCGFGCLHWRPLRRESSREAAVAAAVPRYLFLLLLHMPLFLLLLLLMLMQLRHLRKKIRP
jgi:hypothetical protein